MRILIMYFSGAGSTRLVGERMRDSLADRAHVALHALEQDSEPDLEDWDALVVGTPVYHAAPAKLVMESVRALPLQDPPKPAFLFNTRATWSCNTNRILAAALAEKGVLTVLDRDYRSPASDGALILPFVERFFRFEGGIRERVAADCAQFLALLEQGEPRAYLPRFRLSSVLNAPNKLAGQLVTFRIHLHRARCLGCGHCVAHCPHGALEADPEGRPSFLPGRCENCYRCIHHCPAKALSLSRRRPPARQLHRD